jgi:hypothetical protein
MSAGSVNNKKILEAIRKEEVVVSFQLLFGVSLKESRQLL